MTIGTNNHTASIKETSSNNDNDNNNNNSNSNNDNNKDDDIVIVVVPIIFCCDKSRTDMDLCASVEPLLVTIGTKTHPKQNDQKFGVQTMVVAKERTVVVVEEKALLGRARIH